MDTDLDQLLYILENCSKHHRPEVVAFLRDIRVIVHFLPPYSPDLHPIEGLSQRSKLLRSIEAQIMDIETALLASFATITEQDFRGWTFNTANSSLVVSLQTIVWSLIKQSVAWTVYSVPLHVTFSGRRVSFDRPINVVPPVDSCRATSKVVSFLWASSSSAKWLNCLAEIGYSTLHTANVFLHLIQDWTQSFLYNCSNPHDCSQHPTVSSELWCPPSLYALRLPKLHFRQCH